MTEGISAPLPPRAHHVRGERSTNVPICIALASARASSAPPTRAVRHRTPTSPGMGGDVITCRADDARGAHALQPGPTFRPSHGGIPQYRTEPPHWWGVPFHTAFLCTRIPHARPLQAPPQLQDQQGAGGVVQVLDAVQRLLHATRRRAPPAVAEMRRRKAAQPVAARAGCAWSRRNNDAMLLQHCLSANIAAARRSGDAMTNAAGSQERTPRATSPPRRSARFAPVRSDGAPSTGLRERGHSIVRVAII